MFHPIPPTLDAPPETAPTKDTVVVSGREAPSTVTPNTPPPSGAVKESRLTARLEIAATLTALSFEYPPTAHLGIGGYLPLHRLIGPEAIVMAPITPLRIREQEGNVTVRKALLAVGARVVFPFKSERVHTSMSAGLGLDVTFVEGDATLGLEGTSDTTFAAMPYARLDVEISLTDRVSLKNGLLIGSDIPRTRVTILDRGVVTVSPVLLAGLVGINVEI